LLPLLPLLPPLLPPPLLLPPLLLPPLLPLPLRKNARPASLRC
jgi:hypothetical protein